MNDIELLIKRYLDGLTTTEEERRLRHLLSREDAPQEWRALLPMLEKPAKEQQVDRWLAEDETAAYDRMVRRRKLNKAARIAAAAAAVAIVAILAVDLNHSPAPQQLADTDTIYIYRDRMPATPPKTETAAMAESAKPIRPTQPITTAGKLASKPTKPTQPANSPKSNATNEPKAEKTTDSLAFYLARLEAELDRVGDSVYTAQLEKMIRTDSRLQEIINRKLFEKLLEPDNHTAHNALEQTANDQLQ